MSNTLISISNLHVSYNKDEILQNINLNINQGDFIYLIGETGGGKSTLLKCLYKAVKFDSGEIQIGKYNLSNIGQKELPFLRRDLGIIFQDFQLLSDRNIYDNLEFVLQSTGWEDKNKIKARITEVLHTVHLEKIEEMMPYELSGGEQQRVSIARALLNHPTIILADEPTGNLDPKKSKQIIEIIKEINAKGTTVIIATHDYSVIKAFPNKTYRFENKKMTEVLLP